jgi:hypothetical protein
VSMDNANEDITSTMEPTLRTPKLVASTGDTYCCSIAESKTRQESLPAPGVSGDELPREANEEDAESNYFKSAQWQVPTSSREFLLTNVQVTRWNQHPHLERRQQHPHLHRPSRSPRRHFIPQNPHTIHNPATPYLSQLPSPLPTLHPLRSLHNPLPQHPQLPPNPSPKRPLPHRNTNSNLPPHLPHHRSLLHALLPPLVFPRYVSSRNRLPHRALRRIPQRSGSRNPPPYHSIKEA